MIISKDGEFVNIRADKNLLDQISSGNLSDKSKWIINAAAITNENNIKYFQHQEVLGDKFNDFNSNLNCLICEIFRDVYFVQKDLYQGFFNLWINLRFSKDSLCDATLLSYRKHSNYIKATLFLEEILHQNFNSFCQEKTKTLKSIYGNKSKLKINYWMVKESVYYKPLLPLIYLHGYEKAFLAYEDNIKLVMKEEGGNFY